MRLHSQNPEPAPPVSPHLPPGAAQAVPRGKAAVFKIAGDFKYEVPVSKRARSDRNLPGRILSLSERETIGPTNDGHQPAQSNL
jgi:hypothetical protein